MSKNKLYKTNEMNNKIIQLKRLFLEKVSLDNDVDEEILRIIDEILYFINDSEIDDLRKTSAKLSYELHELGSTSVPYLLMLLLNKLEAVSYKPTYKGTKLKSEIEPDSFMEYFERCFESCREEGIRILTFKMPPLEEKDEVSTYCNVRAMLDFYVSEPINVNELSGELPPRAINLGLSKVLSRKYNCQYEFYLQFSSMLDRMNRDGLYQEARDYAEEALLCSHENNELHYGHYARYSIYTSQTNIIDSLLHGCLLFTSLCNEETICEEFIEKTYTTTFLALRTFNFFDLAKNVYKNYICNLNLDEYDKQKLDLAMFYLRVMEADASVVRDIERYLDTNNNKILKFGKSSLIPWFSLICNIKTIFNEESLGCEGVNSFELLIVSKLCQSEVREIKGKILRGNSDGKAILIDGLVNLSRTRNKADFIHEVNQLVVTANRVVETSVNNKDAEGVLLGHQLKSDGGVYFNGTTLDSMNGSIHQTFNLSGKNSDRFKNYLKFVNDELTGSTSQFVWLGFNNDRAYGVVFENDCFTFCGYIESTNKKEMKSWVKNNLQDLAFDDAPITGSPFITREDVWIKDRDSIIDCLPTFDIPISSNDIVLFSDVEFSSFPHNLIKVDEKIIGLKQAISSPLSFDNYLKYKDDNVCLGSVYAWAPTIEGDIPISIAFSKLQDQLGDFKVTYEESLIPNPNSDINIFITHGRRDGSSGFRGLYPISGKSYNTEEIFGAGKIAILFVCHAGSIVENYYSNSTHTLVKKLLQNGYESVISPSWSLNVSIPGIWTKEFLNSMKAGKNISMSVHKANLHVDSVYLSPSASSAMHLFGNNRITSN